MILCLLVWNKESVLGFTKSCRDYKICLAQLEKNWLSFRQMIVSLSESVDGELYQSFQYGVFWGSKAHNYNFVYMVVIISLT